MKFFVSQLFPFVVTLMTTTTTTMMMMMTTTTLAQEVEDTQQEVCDSPCEFDGIFRLHAQYVKMGTGEPCDCIEECVRFPRLKLRQGYECGTCSLTQSTMPAMVGVTGRCSVSVLYEIDPDTGTTTFIGNVVDTDGIALSLNSITCDLSNDVLYGHSDCCNSPECNVLYALDPGTAIATRLFVTETSVSGFHVVYMTSSSNGNGMYAIDYNEVVYSLSQCSMTSVFEPLSECAATAGSSIDSTDVLHLVGNGNHVTLNLLTGIETIVSTSVNENGGNYHHGEIRKSNNIFYQPDKISNSIGLFDVGTSTYTSTMATNPSILFHDVTFGPGV